MSKTDTKNNKGLSRRKALAILGLATTIGYAAPSVLSLDKASAEERSRSRTRSRSRSTSGLKPTTVRNRSGRSRSRSRSR